MSKKSYEEPMKDKWRDAWLQFVRKNKHSLIGKPKDWNVVFFPSEEALELRVYDSLKIPRENLLGLEIDPKAYDKLKKKDLGIRLTDEPMDAVDFFSTTDEKFDIINLDYKGYINDKVESTLLNISKRHILNKESILGVTLLGQRETKYIQDLYKYYYLNIGALDNNILDFNTEMKNIKLEDARDDGVTRRIISFLYREGDIYSNASLFKRNPKYRILELLKKGFTDNANWDEPLDMKEVIKYFGIQLNAFEEHLLDNNFANSKRTAHELAKLAIEYENELYYKKTSTRYKYISSGSTPMISDFFVFSKYRYLFKKYKYIADHAYIDLDVMDFAKNLSNSTELTKKSLKKAYKIIESDTKKLRKINNIHHSTPPERIFLGSSAKRPELTGKEYYSQRFEDDSSGISKEDTWDRLVMEFKVTRSQLPRMEAHYTMKTHGPKYLHTKEVLPPADDTLEDVVSKEGLVKLDESILAPRRFLDKLSDNATKRIRYFLDEDIFKTGLNNEERHDAINKIKSSKWYNSTDIENFDDERVYAFFDDIYLEIATGDALDENKIEYILNNIKRNDWKNRYKSISPRIGSESNQENKPEISDKIMNLPEDTPLGPRVVMMRREGITKQDVMEELGIKDYKFRGFMAAFQRGAYDKVLRQLDPPPQIYTDSKGVVHSLRSTSIGKIEKGYK